MKHIRIKNGKLYISRPALWTGGIFISLVLLGTFFSLNIQSKRSEGVRPLGIAPSGAESVPKDSSAAAAFMVQKIKEEHLNKLTVIFYYDSYTDQDTALRDAEVLKNTLEKTEPYKSLQDVLTYKIITSGSICEVTDGELVCEPRHLEALTKLGIDHIKIVILHQDNFKPALDTSYGTNTIMALSTFRGNVSQESFENNLKLEFLKLFRKSLGRDATDGYLTGVLTCFYGNKESYKIDGGYRNCKGFKAQYPKFWKGGDL